MQHRLLVCTHPAIVVITFKKEAYNIIMGKKKICSKLLSPLKKVYNIKPQTQVKPRIVVITFKKGNYIPVDPVKA